MVDPNVSCYSILLKHLSILYEQKNTTKDQQKKDNKK